MKKLLIVVDYQVDFVSGTLGNPYAAAIEENICKKIKDRRREGYDVWFTFDTHGADYADTQEGRRLPVAHCLKGTPGWALYGKAAGLLAEGDRCFEKGSFGSPGLFEALNGSGYEVVELVGVVTNICVVSNAVLVKTALPEAEVVVDASCTASNDPKQHEAALDVMESLQVTVTGREGKG